MDLQIKRLDDSLPLPKYETEGSAGMDLYAVEAGSVNSGGGPVLVPTGIAIAVPQGYEAQIRPRSGLAAKHGVTVLNSPGTIDSDFRGQIQVILACSTKGGFYSWSRGDRIAQMVIAPVVQPTLVEVQELDETGRGEGGFGSTGT